MQIGNVNIKNEYILTPMAGFTDLPFRLICSKMGAGMVCMEMGDDNLLFRYGLYSFTGLVIAAHIHNICVLPALYKENVCRKRVLAHLNSLNDTIHFNHLLRHRECA